MLESFSLIFCCWKTSLSVLCLFISFMILFICCHGVSDSTFSNTALQNYKILLPSAAGEGGGESKLLFKVNKYFF